MKKWSNEAWEAVADVYDHTLELPFVKSLAAGTLPKEKFLFYLRQDTLYLRRYFRVLANIASRLDNVAHADAFIRFAADGIAVEKALHGQYLGGVSPTDDEMSPTCALYTSTLLSQALEPVEVEAAAVLPCFWIYQKVGEHILATANVTDSNPYKDWITTYADETFAASTRLAIEICDSLAAQASAAVRDRMTGIFRQCARLEWMFWESAWNLETWKI